MNRKIVGGGLVKDYLEYEEIAGRTMFGPVLGTGQPADMWTPQAG
jgi:hypothetical protein